MYNTVCHRPHSFTMSSETLLPFVTCQYNLAMKSSHLDMISLLLCVAAQKHQHFKQAIIKDGSGNNVDTDNWCYHYWFAVSHSHCVVSKLPWTALSSRSRPRRYLQDQGQDQDTEVQDQDQDQGTKKPALRRLEARHCLEASHH